MPVMCVLLGMTPLGHVLTAWRAPLAVAAAAAVAVALLAGRSKIAKSTLIGPWWWTVAALAVLLVVEFSFRAADGAAESPLAQPWRFIAAVGVFCPLMAVLGARRPHHRAWHLVVASLWLVLSMPALEAI
ncbi:MAG: hypothetical protein KDA41_21165, partial [Planctomycetales bacterium]|nr:hypothetical protein [Planctomycetales bacterium]